MEDPLNNLDSEHQLLQSKEIADNVKNLETPLEGMLLKTDEISKKTDTGNDTLNTIAENTKPKEVQKIENDKLDIIAENTKPKEVQKIELVNDDKELAGKFFSLLRGEKGDRGDKGEKGDKGDKPNESDLISIIKPLIPEPKNGKDGIDGKDGKNGKNGKDGKDGSPDTPKQVKEKLLKVGLDYEELKGLPDIAKMVSIYSNTSSRDYNLSELKDVSIVSPTNNQVLKYNSTTRLWEAGTASGGSTTFIGLTDVPATYTGQALKVVRVNAGETALEFTTLAGGGDALKADPLSQFASTTSLQLAGVISDETGSGALVFGTSPSITSPTFGTSITASYATLSTVPYFDASKNLVSSAVTPTELGYLSGVTSAIQTQINAKAPSTAPTFATSITGSYLTASEILITDGSKNIVSAAVATYPSLTELTYLKGVTSAIQTQINTKANSSGALTQFVGNGNWKVWYSDGSGDVQELALGADGTFLKSNGAAIAPSFATPAGSGDVSKVGTPVNNQVGVWTGDGTIEGDTALTFDTTTDTLATTLITATTVTAALVGNASTATALANARTIGGVSFDGTANIVPQTIQSVNEATDTTCFPLFISASGSQSLQPLNNAGFIYNSNTNALTATTFIGALTGTASGNLVSGGALGTPSSGTGTNITGIPAANILAGSFGAGAYVISTSLQVATLELGHATDTTITRVSAGLIAVEGITVVDVSTAQTLTNKTMIASTNVIEEITTTASSSTPTPTGGSLRNFFTITALAAGATFAAPSGTPADGNYLTIRILDNGTARSLAWNAIYRDGYTGYVTLPTTTILGKTMYVGFRYNGADSKWDLVSVQIMS